MPCHRCCRDSTSKLSGVAVVGASPPTFEARRKLRDTSLGASETLDPSHPATPPGDARRCRSWFDRRVACAAMTPGPAGQVWLWSALRRPQSNQEESCPKIRWGRTKRSTPATQPCVSTSKVGDGRSGEMARARRVRANHRRHRAGRWGLCIYYVREFARTSLYSSFCRSLSVSPLQSCRKKETERERLKDCRAKSRNWTGKCADPANHGVVL